MNNKHSNEILCKSKFELSNVIIIILGMVFFISIGMKLFFTMENLLYTNSVRIVFLLLSLFFTLTGLYFAYNLLFLMDCFLITKKHLIFHQKILNRKKYIKWSSITDVSMTITISNTGGKHISGRTINLIADKKKYSLSLSKKGEIEFKKRLSSDLKRNLKNDFSKHKKNLTLLKIKDRKQEAVFWKIVIFIICLILFVVLIR